MKTRISKLMMVALGMLLSVHANAYDVEIDGIYYNVVAKAKQATVTSGDNQYFGKVVIPENISYNGETYAVTSIGEKAFDSCKYLTSVAIPSNVTSIGDWAFEGCSGLTSVTIPNSVTTIGMGAFSECSGLTSVTIPNSVTTIGMGAFLECSGLTSVTIPNSVTSIDIEAFSGCSGLTSVTIPNSVTSIGFSAFRGCSGLTSVTIPNSVTSIDIEAFRGCSGLTSVTIPNSVTSIDGAFSGCSGLTSVTIPNSVTSIDGAFSGCSGLTSVTIPNSVTSIGSATFSGCSGLTSVTIPNSVTSIYGGAFSGCSGLTSVTIGNSVTYIGESTFGSCSELTDVYCYAEKVPSTTSNAFANAYTEYTTLHVPAGAVESYKSTEPWSGFGKIVALEGEMPEMPKCETPTIAYENGKLSFGCATEGAEFVSDIADEDVKKYYDNTVELTAAYQISVYATLTGYENSDTVAATLCWIDTEPQKEVVDGQVEVKAYPVLIQGNGGQLTVKGVADGTIVTAYTLAGVEAGTAQAANGVAILSTALTRGDTVIVKIGDKSVKVLVK